MAGVRRRTRIRGGEGEGFWASYWAVGYVQRVKGFCLYCFRSRTSHLILLMDSVSDIVI